MDAANGAGEEGGLWQRYNPDCCCGRDGMLWDISRCGRCLISRAQEMAIPASESLSVRLYDPHNRDRQPKGCFQECYLAKGSSARRRPRPAAWASNTATTQDSARRKASWASAANWACTSSSPLSTSICTESWVLRT